MMGNARKIWGAGLLALGVFVEAHAGSPGVGSAITLTNAFSPTTVPLNGVSVLTYTLANGSGYNFTGSIDFNDTLPAGLTVAQRSNNCVPGTVNLTAGGGGATVVQFSGGSLAPTASCTVALNVTGAAAGAQVTAPSGQFTYGMTPYSIAGTPVTLTVTASAATAIPTLSEWALILLVASVAGSALLRLRRRS